MCNNIPADNLIDFFGLFRWYPGISNDQKLAFFRSYRAVQVLNSHWIDLSRHLIFIMLSTLAALLITVLFIVIRTQAGHFSTLNVVVVYIVGINLSIALFIGGEIFFRFSFQLTSNSVNCWLTFLQHGNSIAKADKIVVKSCRHISNTIGFCFIRSREVTLIFFGNIVLKNVIDALLTFR